MLNMGFVDDVEKILSAVDDKNECQTLLFSATLPHWVKQVTTRFLKEGHQTIDLVGDAKMQVSPPSAQIHLPERKFTSLSVNLPP